MQRVFERLNLAQDFESPSNVHFRLLLRTVFFIVLHHLHHVTTDTLQYIRTIIIPNKRTLHNDKKRKMCAVTKVALPALELVTATYNIIIIGRDVN